MAAVGAPLPPPGPEPGGAWLPPVTSVQRLCLQPGDALVVRVDGVVSPRMAEAIAARVQAILGRPGTRVLVMPGEMSVEVLSDERRGVTHEPG